MDNSLPNTVFKDPDLLVNIYDSTYKEVTLNYILHSIFESDNKKLLSEIWEIGERNNDFANPGMIFKGKKYNSNITRNHTYTPAKPAFIEELTNIVFKLDTLDAHRRQVGAFIRKCLAISKTPKDLFNTLGQCLCWRVPHKLLLLYADSEETIKMDTLINFKQKNAEGLLQLKIWEANKDILGGF